MIRNCTYTSTETAQFVFSVRTIVISVAQFVPVYAFFTIALGFVAGVVAVYSAVAPVFHVHAPDIVHARKRVRRTIRIA